MTPLKNRRFHFITLLWASIPFTNAVLQQVPYHQKSFNKTFRRDGASSQNTVELLVEASTGIIEDPIDGMQTGTYLYCLGATKVEVKGIESDLKISNADSLIEVRDRLQKQMPNQIWSILSKVRGGGESGREHVEVKQFFKFSPYVDKFLAASSKHPIQVTIKRNMVEITNLAYLLAGFILFFKAPHIAQQAALWYLGGVSVSVTIGALIMLYFVLNRLIPKRDSILVVGLLSSVGMWVEYFFNGFLRQTVFGLMKTHWNYVLVYFLVFGVAGFVYCYIKGPHTENPRVTNVIQVTLQAMASGLIVYAFNIPEIGCGVLLVLILTYIFYPQTNVKVYDLDQRAKNCNLIHAGQSRKNISISADEQSASKSQRVKKDRRASYVPTPTVLIPRPTKRRSLLPSFLQRSPISCSTPRPKPVRRLMTEDEYLVQGLNTTKIELDRLRRLCKESKDTSPWQVLQSLEDPKRFASFVTGSPHVSQTELDNFETELDSILTGGGSDSDPESEPDLNGEKDSPGGGDYSGATIDPLEADKENSNESVNGPPAERPVQSTSLRAATNAVADRPQMVTPRMRKLR